MTIRTGLRVNWWSVTAWPVFGKCIYVYTPGIYRYISLIYNIARNEKILLIEMDIFCVRVWCFFCCPCLNVFFSSHNRPRDLNLMVAIIRDGMVPDGKKKIKKKGGAGRGRGRAVNKIKKEPCGLPRRSWMLKKHNNNNNNTFRAWINREAWSTTQTCWSWSF